MQIGHWFRYFFVVCGFWLLSAILDFCSFWLRFSHLWLTSYVPSLDAQLTDQVDFHPITSTPVKRGASEPAGKHSLTPSSKSAVEPRSKRHQSSVEGMSVVSPTSRFAYMIWVVSPTHLYKCKFTLWPTSCSSYNLSIDRCDLYRIVLVLTNDYSQNV